MWSTLSLLVLSGSLSSGVVELIKVPSMGHIELFDNLQKIAIRTYENLYNFVQIIYIHEL